MKTSQLEIPQEIECPHCNGNCVVGEGTGTYECPHCCGEIQLTLACPECGAELEASTWAECFCPDCLAEFDPWACSELVAGEVRSRNFSVAESAEEKMSITPDGVPVIDVDLDAPPEERWEHPCRKISAMIGELTDSMIDLAGEALPKEMRFLLHDRGRLAAPLMSLPVGARLGSLYQECRGVARATGVPAEFLALSNCLYDYTQILPTHTPGACSCAAFPDRANQPVMLRFMDWALPETIGHYTVITRFFRDGELAYSSVGFAGFLGVVTAIGPNWAAALNQAPCSWQNLSFLALLRDLPACYAMRIACDNADCFEELCEAISESAPATPFLSLVCGTEPGEVARIEKPNAVAATCLHPSKRQPLLALSNHYLHRNHRHLNGVAEWEDEDGQIWTSDSCERLESVFDLAGSAKGCAKLPALGKFRQDPACNDCTVHLALMRPATGELKLKNFRRGKKRSR